MAKEYTNGKDIVINRPDGKIYDGEWFDGKQHGIGQYTDSTGKVIEAEWNSGRRIKNGKINNPTE